jgi:hypothetical protein
MTHQAAERAVLGAVEKDWESIARQVRTETTEMEETLRHPLLIHDRVVARCFMLGNCRRMADDGSMVATPPGV